MKKDKILDYVFTGISAFIGIYCAIEFWIMCHEITYEGWYDHGDIKFHFH